ncbi:hypothetical protein D3C84_1061880 [compost metagenome]
MSGGDARRLVMLGDDLGSALYGAGSEIWRRCQQPVCGLTTARAWFCIEQAASDFGYRAVWRNSHEAELDIEQVVQVGRKIDLWTRTSKAWRPAEAADINTSSDTLVSWMMVPRSSLMSIT